MIQRQYLALNLCLFCGFLSAPVWALESLGTFRFQDFSLSPRIEVNEPSQGGFELKESWISIQWTKDESVHGQFRMGTLDLIAPSIWFQPRKEGLGLVEAWVEARTNVGKFKVGRINIPGGFESAFEEGFWLMPQSQVKKRSWLFAKDEGFTYEAESKPWLTSMTVHNGESARNLDGKMWLTSRFQWFNNFSGWGVLLTGTNGGTSPVSTASSTALTTENFVFDTNDSSQIRYGTLSFFYLWKRNYWNLEGSRGEIIQKDEKHPFAWGRMDLSWNMGSDLNLLARYEQTQSNLKDSTSIRKISGLGFLLSSQDQLSSLMVFAQHIEEDLRVHNDEAMVIFKINSSSLGI